MMWHVYIWYKSIVCDCIFTFLIPCQKWQHSKWYMTALISLVACWWHSCATGSDSRLMMSYKWYNDLHLYCWSLWFNIPKSHWNCVDWPSAVICIQFSQKLIQMANDAKWDFCQWPIYISFLIFMKERVSQYSHLPLKWTDRKLK